MKKSELKTLIKEVIRESYYDANDIREIETHISSASKYLEMVKKDGPDYATLELLFGELKDAASITKDALNLMRQMSPNKFESR